MDADYSPGEEHELFAEWAFAQGVIANGVTPARFPGRGLGMIATREIKKGEVLVQVPISTIFTVDDVPLDFRLQFADTATVQTVMAAFLTHGAQEQLAKFQLWFKTWPARQDFEDGLPLLWPRELGGRSWPDSVTSEDTTVDVHQSPNLLPPCISGLWNSVKRAPRFKKYESEHQGLKPAQERRLGQAWADVVFAFPETDWKRFSYYWLILNTRSFYWVRPDQEPPENRNDAMALLPFADYFNHSDVECDVKFDNSKYVLRAAEDYVRGEEVYMSYGSHPNDFLLAEYGFFLDENKSDCIYLDEIILGDIDDADKQEELWLNQYYGEYQVTTQGVCYRTEVAACLKYMKIEDWRDHILEGSTKGVDEQRSETIIRKWLQRYSLEADAAMSAIREALAFNPVVQVHQQKAESLLQRWAQIRNICEKASKAVSL